MSPTTKPYLRIMNGDGQSTPGLDGFGSPMQILVTNSLGTPFSGSEVIFSITVPEGSNASATFDSNQQLVAYAATDSTGVVSCPSITAGPIPGKLTVTAICGDAKGVAFSLTVIPPSAAYVAVKSGGNQVVHLSQSQQFQPLIVSVLDKDNNPVLDSEASNISFRSNNPILSFGGSPNAEVNTVQGVATSPDLIYEGPGQFSIVVTAVGSPNIPTPQTRVEETVLD